LIPLRDTIPTRTFPAVTIMLIALNVLAFVYQLSLGRENAALVAALGAVPAQFTGAAAHAAPVVPPALSLLSSMFLHGGILHLAGNMVFLWIFGNNVEDSTGHLRFLAFYLLCGALAAGAHIATHPDSRLPMIGASGAVSGVLGAYFLLYPRSRIVTLIFLGFFAQTVTIPAFFFLGFWFLMQFLSGAADLAGRGGVVAWFAHVGGFAAGMVLLLVFRNRRARLWSPITG
jgi:membrane associated rhomboid family serine protease